MAKQTAGGMLGASPACMDVLQKEPHWSGGTVQGRFHIFINLQMGIGMCRACLALTATVFGMWDDLWHSSASYILFFVLGVFHT